MTTNVNMDYVLHGCLSNRCPRCETKVITKRSDPNIIKGWKCPNCGHHSKNYKEKTKAKEIQHLSDEKITHLQIPLYHPTEGDDIDECL